MLACGAGLAWAAGLLSPGLRRRNLSSLFLVQLRLPSPPSPLGLPATTTTVRTKGRGGGGKEGDSEQEACLSQGLGPPEDLPQDQQRPG